MNKHAVLLCLTLVLLCVPIEGQAVRAPFFTWDAQWNGSYYNSIPRADNGFPPFKDLFPGGTLFNRGDFRLRLPAKHLEFRALATDKRLLPFEDDDGRAGFNPAFGAYHRESGSRFLLGVQSWYGLPARINNVWIRSLPFIEGRGPSSRDLKTEPAAKDESDMYLHLALPPDILPALGIFASAALDSQRNPSLGTGITIQHEDTVFGLEGFYTQKKLPERSASSWFSEAPPLPERAFKLYAASASITLPQAAFSGDWALSQTFAWGDGIYGSAALRAGDKPWRFSLAGDGSTDRFADREGSTAGSGFRLAAKGERFLPRSGLVRATSVIRADEVGGNFHRSSLSLLYRRSAPSARERRANPTPIRFTRASLGFNRDGRQPSKTADSLSALAGFQVRQFNTALSLTLGSLSSFEEGKVPPLFLPPAFQQFDSFKVSGEAGLSRNRFSARTRLSYTTRAKKDDLWEVSASGSFRPGRWGRVSLTITATDFPEKWNYTLGWRFTARSP